MSLHSMAAKTIRSNIALLIELVYMFAKGDIEQKSQ